MTDDRARLIDDLCSCYNRQLLLWMADDIDVAAVDHENALADALIERIGQPDDGIHAAAFAEAERLRSACQMLALDAKDRIQRELDEVRRQHSGVRAYRGGRPVAETPRFCDERG